MSELRNYDVKQVYVIVGGVALTGFAEDSVVEVAYNEDQATLQIGAQGEGTVSHSNNYSGSFTVHLQQTSPSNAYLSLLAQAFRTGSGFTVPVLVKDGSGTTICSAEKALVPKIPDLA